MKIAYETWNPGPDAITVIRQADEICRDYAAQGYDLTLRQLYYQFVARDLIPNTMRSYKRVGDIVNKARLAGYLDWNYIVDRTRNLRSVSHWTSPGSIISSAARSFALDKWDDQPVRVEVWVEKEALAGIVGQVAERNDVAWFSCRGYVSQSEIWGAAQRHFGYIQNGQRVVVIHLGDHDPSGIDMTRDIRDRLQAFIDRDWLNAHASDFPGDSTTLAELRMHIAQHAGAIYGDHLEVRRIALNMDQVEQYGPPPNPAKLTDSRANGYLAEYGHQSWELDALDPAVLDALIEENIHGLIDWDLYESQQQVEAEHRDLLEAASRRWTDVAAMLGGDR